MLVRVFEGTIAPKQKILLVSNKKVRIRSSASSRRSRCRAAPRRGRRRIVVANVKDVQDAKVGDTITEADRPTEDPFPGFKVVKPMVFSGVFPIEARTTSGSATRS